MRTTSLERTPVHDRLPATDVRRSFALAQMAPQHEPKLACLNVCLQLLVREECAEVGRLHRLHMSALK